MANPTRHNCAKDAWTQVGTNVTSSGGTIKKISNKPKKYLFTYRVTGDAAPTSASEGDTMFVKHKSEEEIQASGIDLYIYAVGKAGKVRVSV